MVHEAEMIYTKRIFCYICPCPSLAAANSKSLLTTHIHSFLHSVSSYWASNIFQAPASTLETQKLKKTSSSQFGGLDFRVILMVTMAWKYSFKSKCKNWFLTVQKLRIQISQRTYFEGSPCHTPIPHLPQPHLPHPNVDRGQADIWSSVALWSRHYLMLHGSLVHSGTRRNGASRTFHPASHLMMYLKCLFLGCLMNDIYKVSFSSPNQKILKFLLSCALPARVQCLYGRNLEQVTQFHFCAHCFATEMQTPLGNSKQFLYPEIISGHRAAQLQPALCALHNTVTFSESGKIYSVINCLSILNHSRDSLLKRGPRGSWKCKQEVK